MKRISTIITALALIVLASCKGEYEALLASGDADAKYKAAFKYFEAKKYNKAAQLFESLSVMSSGTERDDTVQYYWALSILQLASMMSMASFLSIRLST